MFKIGRTTGATMGIIDDIKTIISDETLVVTQLLPVERTFDGRAILTTSEWNVSGAEMWEGVPFASGKTFALGGDSGAWVVNANSQLLGMVFYGHASTGKTHIQDINTVRKHIRLITGADIRLTK